MKTKKYRKAIATVLLSAAATTMIPTAALAENVAILENMQIAPHLTCIEAAETDLVINNGTAIVDCWVEGDYYAATKAKVIAELQLKSGSNWIAYGTWVNTQNDYEAYVYETKSVTKGHTYRVKATYTVWEGSVSEELVVFSDEVTA